ncbi:MAG TPA: DUF805 domain-containing protein [Caldimonas sp.]|jgi:uncharacterized membrane protein YhaH (DUF805 family)|nr:DUF805 domain-containing protein [Caldimonas sp.]HEX4235737.1 DUF805 domain-containing protein [Caldimonas sp.]
MDEGNRFAPPATAVADIVDTGEQPIRLWPPTGRIGRLRFLAYGLGCYIVFVVASFVFGVVAALLGRGSVLATTIAVLGFVVYLAAEVTLMIQRSHDLDLSGWWSIAAMIPLIGLFWVFKGGTRGVNRWGAPPPPNGLAVRVFGLLLPVLVIVGVIAAVALPAYQAYSSRAISGQAR